jgi:hypothetical protein
MAKGMNGHGAMFLLGRSRRRSQACAAGSRGRNGVGSNGDPPRVGDVATPRSGMGQRGRQELSQMTWNELTSWAGLTLAVVFLIFAALESCMA